VPFGVVTDSKPEWKRLRSVAWANPDVFQVSGIIERVKIAMRRRKDSQRTLGKTSRDRPPAHGHVYRRSQFGWSDALKFLCGRRPTDLPWKSRATNDSCVVQIGDRILLSANDRFLQN